MNVINRIAHNCQQGSPEWFALRASHFTASEAAAMLGVSKYQTRTALLRQKATGVAADVSADRQNLFDKGHAAEAAARPIVEAIINDELFPVTMTAEIDGLPLLASMDGLTMLGEIGWETKLLNNELREAVQAGVFEEHYTAQMEQQLMVSGAERIYFTATDGTPEGTVGMWYESNPELRKRIIAGWKQFAKDLADYVPEPANDPAPVGRAPDALPALHIEVTGMVTASNLDAFREHALAVFAGIKTDLQTDADFADAERTVKWCKEVEDRLEAAKQHALSQTASIDELFRTIDAIKDESRQKRLMLDKLVKAEKDKRKTEIVMQAQRAIADHVQQLNARIAPASIPTSLYAPHMFGEAIKGLKSLDSIRDKVGNVLANAKIETNAVADRIDANRKMVEDMSLVPDFGTVCTKAPEDFAALLAMRKQQRAEAEERRLQAERDRIRAEEQAKAAREAAEIARKEIEAKAKAHAEEMEVERAKLQAEREAQMRAQQEAIAKRAAEVAARRIEETKPAQAIDAGARLKLGDINARIAPLAITADGLAQLGFQPVGREGAARLYRASDLPAICAALIDVLRIAAGEAEHA